MFEVTYNNRGRSIGLVLGGTLILKPWIAVVAVLLAAACGVDRGEQKAAVPSAQTHTMPSRETFALGTVLTSGGAVARESMGDSFHRGGEVFLSVDLSGTNLEQAVEVQWVAPDGVVLQKDARSVPAGARYIAFSSGPTAEWPEGDHRAIIAIDGRAVSEKAFRMIASSARL